MAAMGETYVCEPEKVSSVFDKDLTVSDFQSLVIDLDRGTRILAEGREYNGSCEKSELEIICVTDNSDIGYLAGTVLTLEDSVFTRATQHNFRDCKVS
tara:strand:+ start:287 stop:580 length:294 start_codon:yes stop_codon:yes gene_type:complete